MKTKSAMEAMAGALAAWMLTGWTPSSAQPSAPEPPTALSNEAQDVEKLGLTQDIHARMTIGVTINGQGPFPFLVDTGADRTAISRELAATLKLPLGPQVVMHDSTGADVVQTVVIDHLGIGSRVVDHIDAPALAAVNLGAAGMLGVDSLRDQHIVMDFETMRMSSSPSRPESVDADTIVVHGRSRFGQLILVDAAVQGVRVYVVLDSGSELSVGNPALLKLLTGEDWRADPGGAAQIVSVTGHGMSVEMKDVAETHIGGLVIRNMPLAFAQLHTFDRFGLTRQPALLLGMDVLRQCRRVSVDLRRREATFTLN